MKRIIYLMLLSLVFNSCENFLNLEPISEVTTANFYKNANDLNNGVIACYAKLQSQMTSVFDMMEYRSDNLYLDAPTTGTQDRYDIDHYEDRPDNSILSDIWGNYYNGIYRCNEVIVHGEKVSMDEGLKKQYIAEAKFIRALTYFNLVRFWGGVPIVTEPTAPKKALTIGRSNVTSVYQLIEEDLLFASQNLKNTYPTVDLGRATSVAANVLLAKVYLTQKKYTDSRRLLNEISTTANYGLETNVANVFSVTNKIGKEIVFAIRYNKDIVGMGHGQWYTVNDISTSPISKSLISSYSISDKRKLLIEYKKDGSLYMPNKFYDQVNTTTKLAGNDFIILRWADVLLMKAEVANELAYSNDENGEAFKNINAVHTRAGLNPYTSAELNSQDLFRKAIINERRLEFALEGQRWFDQVRFGIAQSESNVPEHRLIYPVPRAEIEKVNNKNIFDQNPGYSN